MHQAINDWPSLPYDKWKNTLDTLHMWMQIVGKIKLKLNPFLNQWWEVAFYVNAQGITTGPIYCNEKVFEVDFNFIYHQVQIKVNDGSEISFPLKSYCVSEFYNKLMSALKSFGIEVDIYDTPVEFSNPIEFTKDSVHCSYDKEHVECWWKILIRANLIFDLFRSDFRGKSSPVLFYWGSFDLNSTRFNGKKTKPPKMKGIIGRIMEFAENEENFAFGFWPGDERYPAPAFYSYMYPEPEGKESINFKSSLASFNDILSEYILPYEDVIKSSSPEKEIEDFLRSTYVESAKLAKWDIESLTESTPFNENK